MMIKSKANLDLQMLKHVQVVSCPACVFSDPPIHDGKVRRGPKDCHSAASTCMRGMTEASSTRLPCHSHALSTGRASRDRSLSSVGNLGPRVTTRKHDHTSHLHVSGYPRYIHGLIAVQDQNLFLFILSFLYSQQSVFISSPLYLDLLLAGKKNTGCSYM